jgi:hypothetical protein
VRLALIALLLTGCVHVAYEPALEMPERPKLHWTICGEKQLCLSEADADKLAKFLDKLNAFEAARQRAMQE